MDKNAAAVELAKLSLWLVTLSADLAAMAPQTTIGAASVVGGGGEEIDETMAARCPEGSVARAGTPNSKQNCGVTI